jgi:tRNA(His) 5'-end guanylyltransferase
MQSIIASLATAKFNQLMVLYNMEHHPVINPGETIKDMKLAQFDCKCWNVPSINDVFAWFLYRQIDCVRNSKQQTAQTYIPHKMLLNLDADTQIKLLIEEKGIDWNCYPMSHKYGRFIWKQKVLMSNIDTGELYHRHKWLVQPAFPLMDENGRDKFFKLDIIPNNV